MNPFKNWFSPTQTIGAKVTTIENNTIMETRSLGSPTSVVIMEKKIFKNLPENFKIEAKLPQNVEIFVYLLDKNNKVYSCYILNEERSKLYISLKEVSKIKFLITNVSKQIDRMALVTS